MYFHKNNPIYLAIVWINSSKHSTLSILSAAMNSSIDYNSKSFFFFLVYIYIYILMDFKTRFKGKTSTMDKNGVIGVVSKTS